MLRNIFQQLRAFSFATEVTKAPAPKASSAPNSLTYYKDGQLTTRTAIVLKKQ